MRISLPIHLNPTHLLRMIAFLLVIPAVPAVADIFMYVDQQGVMHFTNNPTTSEYQVCIKDTPKQNRDKVDTDRYDQYISDIYMDVDQEGDIHFTNDPATGDCTKIPRPKNFQVNRDATPKQRRGRVDTDRYDQYITKAAGLHGVEFPLIKAVIRAESAFNPMAVSNKGALGLMQIMPQNLEAFRVYDPFDPWQNIMGGSRYLKELILRFGGELKLALAAYNAGPRSVDNYHGIPPYPETEAYVEEVMRLFQLYKNK